MNKYVCQIGNIETIGHSHQWGRDDIIITIIIIIIIIIYYFHAFI